MKRSYKKLKSAIAEIRELLKKERISLHSKSSPYPLCRDQKKEGKSPPLLSAKGIDRELFSSEKNRLAFTLYSNRISNQARKALQQPPQFIKKLHEIAISPGSIAKIEKTVRKGSDPVYQGILNFIRQIGVCKDFDKIYWKNLCEVLKT